MSKFQHVAMWSCVHFLNSESTLATIKGELPEITILECGVSDVNDDSALLGKLSASLQFPDYFGNNWDAFDECISDMEWMPASGYVLVVSGAKQLWSNAPASAGKLVSAWLLAASSWASENVPFHLVFLSGE